MKGFLSCVAAMTWIGLVIYRMWPRLVNPPLVAGWAESYAYPEHPVTDDRDWPNNVDYLDLTDLAHRGGRVPCPAHGRNCARARIARQTAFSQADEDAARRAAINGAH